MLYVKVIDGIAVKYPYTQTDLVWDNPSTSFPVGGVPESTLVEWDMFPVHFADQPVIDPLAQRVVEIAPSFDGQSWIQQWAVEALPQAEIDAMTDQQAASVRADRNARLAATDWTQIADSTADKPAWAAYRQALRDVPAQGGFPQSVTWPEQP
jgi:hypothetical protein